MKSIHEAHLGWACWHLCIAVFKVLTVVLQQLFFSRHGSDHLDVVLYQFSAFCCSGLGWALSTILISPFLSANCWLFAAPCIPSFFSSFTGASCCNVVETDPSIIVNHTIARVQSLVDIKY